MPRASTVVHVQPPTTTLSLLCEGLPHEERRQALNGHYSAIEKLYDDTVAGIGKAKATIEEARVKYENMNDMVRTLEQLRCSLEQHIRTVRLNEGSFAGTSSVLEYDAAKSRTNNLISVIKARSQWELAKEHLKEEGRDDQQKIYECLADMQSSQETLFKFVSNGFDIREFEDMKDRYLAWQSAALIFAIQQADFEKLTDIQKIYETLGRKNEFVSIFRRVSMNRLREFSADGPSVQFVIDALYKELEFVFTHHHRVLRRFLDDDAASALLSEAIQEGLKEINLTEPFSNLISVAENPIELLQKTSKFLATRSDSSSKVVYLANISQQLKCEIVHDLMIPFRSALLSYILSRINTLDLNSGSFRSRVESLKTSIAELLHLLTDVFIHSEALFGRDVKDVVQQPIDKGVENFLAKLKSWQYWLDSHGRPRSLEDIITVCSASGQLVFGIQEFKTMVTESSLSPNIKPVLKWNRGVCDLVLRTAVEKVVQKMKTKIEEIKSTVPTEPRMINLPSFSTSPHEYITTTGQELLQLFHLWEQFFLDDNVVYSFFIALKKKFEGDELFKKTVSDVANSVITEFVSSVGDPSTYSKDVAKQFYADTVFLKDAFEDLRTGNVEQLSALETKLMNVLEV